MTNANAQTRMEQLVAELHRYNHHYYTLDNPVVSDKEYDKLYDELVALEKETGTVLPDSPTQRLGAICSRGLSRIAIYPVYGAWTKRRMKRICSLGISVC